MSFSRKNLLIAFIFFPLLFSSCMKWENEVFKEEIHTASEGLFILCEGNFQYGNSTLSFYNPENSEIINEAFFKANGMKLGDVAQSMTFYNNLGWIVVNNSHVIFAIDTETLEEKGRIENLTSPRYIHFVSPTKAYVSQIWDNRIFIVNPATFKITGYIEVPGMSVQSGSTEQMVQVGKYVYCSCWSYQNKIIKIDTESDSVVGSVEVGIQPSSLVVDCKGRLWTITDGGYEGSPYGYESPALCCIDPTSMHIESRLQFKIGEEIRKLTINKDGDMLYWIADDIWRMNIESERLPVSPVIKSLGTKYFGITISPYSGDIYVSDAIDYQQQGIVYRFTEEGNPIDEFYTGVNPGAFCWK